MKKSLSIVILAAGKGSRMKSSKAKVLHKISGKEMLYYNINESLKLSDDVIVVVAHQKDDVIDAMSKYFNNITFVTQDALNYPGTGGAMMGVKPKNDRVLVLNADMPLVKAEALSGFIDSKKQVIMSIFELENPNGYGRVVIKDNLVQEIVEQKDCKDEQLKIQSVNAGIYAFDNSILEKYIPLLSNENAQKEYYLTDIIKMAKDDNIEIEPLKVDEEYFKGVNSKKDLADAELIMQDRIKSEWMAMGVSMQLPNTIYIESSVVFEGECELENGVRITGDTLIKDSHIKAHSIIEDSIVKNSDIGPLAHLRPASNVEDTHIGNFVEVKKSSLKGVKAGHLSYLGDSIINEGTNIGAGVITCNYDGVKKYQTIIGKNVFVGSDTQLVAPVIVEDNVLIAAGSTITDQKVKSGVLAISRTKMKQIDGFFAKFFKK